MLGTINTKYQALLSVYQAYDNNYSSLIDQGIEQLAFLNFAVKELMHLLIFKGFKCVKGLKCSKLLK